VEKARGEKTVCKALEAGMSAQDAFRKFGILSQRAGLGSIVHGA